MVLRVKPWTVLNDFLETKVTDDRIKARQK